MAKTRAGPAPEALVVCRECGAGIPTRAYEAHLRRAHGAYEHRGRRGSLDEVAARLADEVVRFSPDAQAWENLHELARDIARDAPPDAGGEGPKAVAARFLATRLRQALERPGDRAAVCRVLGPLLAGLPGGAELALALAAEPGEAGRLLALSVLAALPEDYPPEALRLLAGLLADRDLPEEAQRFALVAALRQHPDETDLGADLAEHYVAGLGRPQQVARLHALGRPATQHPGVEEVRGRVEENLRMACPRCGVELRRPAMVEHLWAVHRLVLDGLRTREPWSALARWVESFRRRPDPAVLARCRRLAKELGGEDALARLYRLMLARGVADDAAQRALLEEADRQHASRCPWCYALVPVSQERPARPVTVWRGRLEAGEYQMSLVERGFRAVVELRAPGLRERLPWPGRRWTGQRFLLALGGPPALAAVVLAALWPGPPLLPVLGALGLAVLLGLLGRLAGWIGFRRSRSPQVTRRLAWGVLVPRLLVRPAAGDDSGFLAGLAQEAQLSGDLPRPEVLRPALLDLEERVAAGKGAPEHLAALRRLQVESAVAGGADPVPLVTEQLGRSFEGRLPLSHAQSLLGGWQPPWWGPEARARARVLLCDRAFGAGFEVGTLLDAGHTAPAVGELLGADHPRRLAALRLLWSLRATRPWDRLGPSRTAFELAAEGGSGGTLTRHPDLLLAQERPDWDLGGPTRLALGAEGVYFQGVRFAEPPRVVEVRRRRRGWELRLGESVFRSPDDLEGLARHLERWFRYAFHDLLPRVDRVATWQPPDRSTLLRAWGAVPCPDCTRPLLPRVGRVGLALDDAES